MSFILNGDIKNRWNLLLAFDVAGVEADSNFTDAWAVGSDAWAVGSDAWAGGVAFDVILLYSRSF